MNQVKFKISQKAAFLDRDGVINEDTGYLHNIKDFKWIEGAIEALKILKENNFLIIIISNQSGVARGYFSEQDVHNLHKWINLQLSKHNIKIDDFFFATELPEAEISKNKKKTITKMIEEAIEKYNLNRDDCFMIGDKNIDVLAAKNAKIRGFLFEGGNLSYKIKKNFKYHLN